LATASRARLSHNLVRLPAALHIPRKDVRIANLSDLREVAVATKAVLETGRSIDAIFDQSFTSVVPLLNEPIAHGKPVALDSRPPVRPHADLREARDILRQFLGLCACATFRRHVLT